VNWEICQKRGAGMSPELRIPKKKSRRKKGKLNHIGIRAVSAPELFHPCPVIPTVVILCINLRSRNFYSATPS
jgi:hypothetical protein